MTARANVEKVWLSKRHARPALVYFTKLNDLIGVRIGQGTQQYAIDDTEDRGRCADAECECQDCDGREAGPPCKTANAVAKIFDQCLHSHSPPGEFCHKSTGCTRELSVLQRTDASLPTFLDSSHDTS